MPEDVERTPKNLRKFSVNVPYSTYEELCELAEQYNATKNQVIVKAILALKSGLKEIEPPRAKRSPQAKLEAIQKILFED